jgi:hypothetical protein
MADTVFWGFVLLALIVTAIGGAVQRRSQAAEEPKKHRVYVTYHDRLGLRMWCEDHDTHAEAKFAAGYIREFGVNHAGVTISPTSISHVGIEEVS